MPTTTHPAWHDHPLVKETALSVGGDPLAFCEKFVEVLTDLEDRFPGVPFGRILATGGDTATVSLTPADREMFAAARLRLSGPRLHQRPEFRHRTAAWCKKAASLHNRLSPKAISVAKAIDAGTSSPQAAKDHGFAPGSGRFIWLRYRFQIAEGIL